jgi:glycosyltransferase involved in cell wall biosynthesis
VDVNELQAFFGKQPQAELKKTLQRLMKLKGWPHVNILHLSGSPNSGGLPELLYWWVQVFNALAGDLGQARWEVPFDRQAFLESIILPSGQVIAPEAALGIFFETAKKFKNAVQYNTGQTRPLPGQLTVRGNHLVAVQCGLQFEVQERVQLRAHLAEYFQPARLERLLGQPPEAIAAQIITVDDLELYEAALRVIGSRLEGSPALTDVQIVMVHNFRPLGLLPLLRRLLPDSLLLWRNHLATTDPTPVVWNYFVPLMEQADGGIFHLPEYNPSRRAEVRPAAVPLIEHLPSLYPFSPKNRELKDLGPGIVKRVLAQYQRDYTLASKYDLKGKLERAFLKVTGTRAESLRVEKVLDPLTKASIRASFMEEGRRPEVERFVTRAASEPEGMLELVRQIHGLDPARPLFTQIARFDRFKDPVGTLRAFVAAYLRLAQEGSSPSTLPQFAYAGTLDDTDPEAFEELIRVEVYLAGLSEEIGPELHHRPAAEREELVRQLRHDLFVLVLPNHDRLANAIEVNALQRSSRAVIQKSLREGFGLAVTEAMWKGVPVIGGNTDGIRLQIDHGTNGFLAGQNSDGELKDSVEDTAQFILTYAKHPEVAQRMGEMGRRKVAKEFLLPVNLNLLLRKVADLAAAQAGRPVPEPNGRSEALSADTAPPAV